MDNFYSWDGSNSAVFISILSALIGFTSYWFISQNLQIKYWFFKKYAGQSALINYILFQRMTGVFFLGILPGVTVLYSTDYSLTELGMSLGQINTTLCYLMIFAPILAFLGYINSKNHLNQKVYPQMRFKAWSKKTYLINIMGWVMYLFMYEFMFRGILLMSCYDAFGFWPALAINVCFYSSTHIAKGLGETLGTFPYGIVLCFATIASGSIAFAFISHLILALINDYFSLRYGAEGMNEG